MVGKIIWWVVVFGCAILFYAIGSYAGKLTKPMWFWSGTEVKASEITDVEAYNKENARMWKLYSLWYWASGLAEIWSEIVALVLLLASCSVGLVFLVRSYQRIYKKYKAQ